MKPKTTDGELAGGEESPSLSHPPFLSSSPVSSSSSSPSSFPTLPTSTFPLTNPFRPSLSLFSFSRPDNRSSSNVIQKLTRMNSLGLLRSFHNTNQTPSSESSSSISSSSFAPLPVSIQLASNHRTYRFSSTSTSSPTLPPPFYSPSSSSPSTCISSLSPTSRTSLNSPISSSQSPHSPLDPPVLGSLGSSSTLPSPRNSRHQAHSSASQYSVEESLGGGWSGDGSPSSLPRGSSLHQLLGKQQHWRKSHVAEKFEKLLSDNKVEMEKSRIAHHLFSILILLSAASWGVSTYFDRTTNKEAFVAFFGVKLFFLCGFIAQNVYEVANGFSSYLLLDFLLNFVGIADFILSWTIVAEAVEMRGSVHKAILALETIQLFRMYRLLFFVKELHLLTMGIIHSLRSLRWAALFVVLVIYGCAIFTTWTFGHGELTDEMDEMWGSIVNSLFTLFTVLTLEGWNDICQDTAQHHPYSKIFFVLYICFATLTLMNVVTGVVLDAYVEMSQRVNAGREYEKSLRSSRALENTLRSAFRAWPLDQISRPQHVDAKKALFKWKSKKGATAVTTTSNHYGNVVPGLPRIPSETSGLPAVPQANSGDCRPQFSRGRTTSTSWSPVSGREERGDSRGNAGEDRRGNDHQAVAEGGILHMGVQHACEEVKCDFMISTNDPSKILLRSDVASALEEANIPLHLAFNVLHVYHAHNVTAVSVSEFCEGCFKLDGQLASARHIMDMDVSVRQKLHCLECKIDHLIAVMGNRMKDLLKK